MNNKICFFDKNLCFNVSSDLEKYRAESLLVKESETIAWIDGWDLNNYGKIFYDVGANIGIYSLYAGFKYPNMSIFSFEPTSSNYRSLIGNINLNEFNNISPFHFALAKNNGLVNLYLSDLRQGASGAQINNAINENGDEIMVQKVEQVLALSMDHLVFENNFPIPSYIKIDVDGHETEILNGMLRTLTAPKLKSILVEFNNENEFLDWSQRLEKFGLHLDQTYDNVPNHSSKRRLENGVGARNYIFTRSD